VAVMLQITAPLRNFLKGGYSKVYTGWPLGLESHGILEDHIPGLDSHGKQQRSWKVMEKSHIMS